MVKPSLAAACAVAIIMSVTGCSDAGGAKGDAPQAELNEEQVRGAKRTGVLKIETSAPAPINGQKDYFEVELAPYESVELKYAAPKDARIAFRWTATGKVRSDLHATPTDGGEDLTESYSMTDGTQMQGLYTAAFDGIHGWYWQNRTVDKITLRLEASGGFTESTLITDSSYEHRPLNPKPFS
ncbi:hypothetical protein [uncultured Brevundimonas sp.]|uniref:hypothetical protein n=1 Tax=uncultured Brevundimonas sp. TaxID=213418 RepID=UPI00262A5D73|nr:hypothetical protein [uncultured Brevundimonas sp.]